MEITYCGFNMRHQDGFKIERLTGTGDYLLLILRSPAYIQLSDTLHYTKGHCVIVFNKNTPHIFGTHNAEFVNDWVQFEVNEEDITFFKEIGIVFDTIMEFKDVYALSKFVKQICTEKWSNNINAAKSVNLLIRLLFLKLSDYYATEQVDHTRLSEQLAILRNDIYTSPFKDWSIQSVSESMSISPSYLQHKYKQLFGNSIKKDITASRMEYSKNLLVNTNYSILKVSQMTGYENDVHFMRVFKNEMGCTPTQYRRSSSEQK